MVKTFDITPIKDHIVFTDNGKRVLLDTGCPYIITEENKHTITGGARFLDSAKKDVASDIDEFRGMEYFEQHKVLLDFSNLKVYVADPDEALPVDSPVAEFGVEYTRGRIMFDLNVGGSDRKMIFDTGASITDYMSSAIARTGTYFDTIEDFNPFLGKFKVDRYKLTVKVGTDTFDIPFGELPAPVGAEGIIGVGLYKRYKVLFGIPGKKLVLGR